MAFTEKLKCIELSFQETKYTVTAVSVVGCQKSINKI